MIYLTLFITIFTFRANLLYSVKESILKTLKALNGQRRNKMKKLMLAVMVLYLAFLAEANAAGNIEDKITFNGETSHVLSIFESGQFGKSDFGWSAYFLAGQCWSEGYAGPTWTPALWISLSASVGVQSTDSGSNPVRFAGSVWIGNSFGSIISVYERGAKASDEWWKVIPTVNLGHGIRAGAILEKDLDVAPLVEVDILKTGLAIWGAYYQDGSQIGIRYNF